MKKEDTVNISFKDLPALSEKSKYYDGDLFFADDITCMPEDNKRFKVQFVVLIFCLGGEVCFELNENEYTLHTNDAMFVEANSVIMLKSIKGDCRFKLCAINTSIRYSLINKTLFEAILNLQSNPVVTLSDSDMGLVVRYYELANYKMTNTDYCANHESMINILHAFAIDLLTSISNHVQNDGSIMRQGDKLYRKFVYLASTCADGKRSVKSFADELCVSSKYLSWVCRTHSGKSANEIIQQGIVARITQLLLYSDMSIKEIATSLRFENLSFFGKYVKKHLGLSPNNYRKQHGYGV